jgi:hypothetical protein
MEKASKKQTIFSRLANSLPNKIHAVPPQGLELKITSMYWCIGLPQILLPRPQQSLGVLLTLGFEVQPAFFE